MPNHPSAAAEWLVIAAVCDCPHVAITVMNNHDPANVEADEDEATATGSDWRALVPKVAGDLVARTGLTLSGKCSVALTKDPATRAALTTEVVNLVYALADASLTPSRNANPKETAMTRDQIAQEAAEHIAGLMPKSEEFHAHPDVTVHYLDDTRPPTDIPGIKAALLDGRYWISWMDDHLTAAMEAMAAASA